MKVLAVIKYVFVLVGVALLMLAWNSYRENVNFQTHAVSAVGHVVSLKERRTDNNVTYAPTVSFKDKTGSVFSFTSSTGSSPAAYSPGELVEVFYLPESPLDSARLDGVFEAWGATIILSVLGVPFLFVGLLIVLFGVRKKRKSEWLHKHGVAVEADFEEVQHNYSVSINGRSPYVIVCHWLNPKTQELHVFESENIWFDPYQFIGDRKIRVVVDQNNYRKYFVDISFLPTVAR